MKSRVVKVWRNSGGWANMYIDFENKTRLVIRLFNEGCQDVKLEKLVSTEKQMIVILSTGSVAIESDIVGREYDLTQIIRPKRKNSRSGSEYFNKDYVYFDEKEKGTVIINSMLKDFFDLAYSVSNKMIKDSK